MPESDLDPADPGYDATSPSQPSGSRPGTQPSAPSASHYMPELPYAEELQALLEGKYIVESFLGQGGMGAVYRGLQMPLKRPVAIKILAKQQAGAQDDFDFEERFKREAYAMAALTHPNIVQVYDCGDAGEHWLFISMELVEGGDLSDAIKNGLVTPEAALAMIGPICDGLGAAHDRGLVHRDIKPANIFLTADGKPKVADFGLAKKFDVKDTFVTKTGMGMGTPDYAAPEQYEGIPDIDHRADIYALGVMFYQMLTGSLPRGAYKAPSLRVPVDPRIDKVVSRAMEQDRNERYQSVAELKKDVQQILATWMASPAPAPASKPGTNPTGARPTGPSRSSTQAPLRTGPIQHRTAVHYQQPPPERSGSGFLAMGFIAVVVIGVGAFFFLRKPQLPPSASAAASSSASSSAGDAGSSDASLSPVVTPRQETAAVAGRSGFSSFAPGAVWTDALADPTIWDGRWKRVGSEMHIAGESSSLVVMPDMGLNAGLRARFRARNAGMFFDLIHRMVNNGPRYVVTIWSNEVLNGAIDIVPPQGQGQRRRLQGFQSSMPVGTGVEHTAELYVRGDEITFFFDGQQVATAKDATLKDGTPAILAGKGMEVISLEACALDGTAPPTVAASGEGQTFAGHRYLLVEQKGILFSEAKARAESMGGHLATISSREEQDFLVQLCRKGRAVRPRQIWIGGERTKQGPDGWTWVTGEPFTFHAWAKGSPSGNMVGHRLALIFNEGDVGWNDYENPENRPSADRGIDGFLVEWDGVTGAPGNAPALASAPAAPTASMAPAVPGVPVSSRADLEETDVLARLDLAKHVIPFAAQEWRKGANGLEVANPQNPNTTKGTVELPVTVARSYAVEATFKTRNINGEFGFVLPLGDGARVACHVLAAAGGWAGLDVVDGKQVHEPGIVAGVASPFQVPSQVPVTMRAEVRRSAGELDIRFLIDGRLMGAYKGAAGRLALHRSWKVGENKDAIYLACRHNAGGFQTTFSRVIYRALDLVAEVAAGDPRLAQLDTGFRARYEADAEKPFLSGLASLTQSYLENGIARARAAAQARGDLNEVTALDEEKTRMEKGERLPAEDAPDTPAALKGLRAAFRGAVAKLENERAKVAVPIFDIYLKALDAHATELTRSNKADEAQRIRLVRAEVAEEKAKLLPDFSTSRNGSSGRPPR